MEEHMPRTCKVDFPDHNALAYFDLIIQPDEGFWSGGRFRFNIHVPDDYNIVVNFLFRFKYCLIIIVFKKYHDSQGLLIV